MDGSESQCFLMYNRFSISCASLFDTLVEANRSVYTCFVALERMDAGRRAFMIVQGTIIEKLIEDRG